MLVFEDKMISGDLFEQEFICNLTKCKGACCVADAGVLKKEELKILKSEYNNYKEYLTEEGIQSIEENGFYTYDKEEKDNKTMLIKGGPCAYINYDKNGVAVCGIENAYFDGKTKFRKPISCHLYPIRVSQIGELKAVNYEEWTICSDACALGKELKTPVYRFLKEPLIRAFGEEFYDAIDAYYQQKFNSNE